jgi:hypothetical protein
MKQIAVACVAGLVATCALPANLAPTPTDDVVVVTQVVVRDIAFLDSNTALLRFDPPPVYALWLAQVKECSGLSETAPLTYYVAPRVIIGPDGRLAEYIVGRHKIIFGLGAETVAWIVRHEQLHSLIDEPGHPDEYYKEKCGLLVNPPKP